MRWWSPGRCGNTLQPALILVEAKFNVERFPNCCRQHFILPPLLISAVTSLSRDSPPNEMRFLPVPTTSVPLFPDKGILEGSGA